MPQIKQKVIKFIESPTEDKWLYEQCMKYSNITLDQLGYVCIMSNVYLYLIMMYFLPYSLPKHITSN